MTGVELIAAERRRQVEEEGWGPEHDDGHQGGDLAAAAACYAAPTALGALRLITRECLPSQDTALQRLWPWDRSWWKPSRGTKEGRIRDLVKSGALIAAEIDRLQRL